MSADAPDNELTPREFGLLAGHAWGLASQTAPADSAEVAETGIVPLELPDVAFRMDVGARMAEFPDSVGAESEFWYAFVHGFQLSSSRTWRRSATGTDRGTALVDAPIRR
jgi:hypothetical protein